MANLVEISAYMQRYESSANGSFSMIRIVGSIVDVFLFLLVKRIAK